MIDHFHDKENGGFFFTADNAEIVLNRLKEIFDSAMPSGMPLPYIIYIACGI